MPKYVIRFFFDYHPACLWAADEATRNALGVGPIDDHPMLQLSDDAKSLISDVGFMHSGYLNPEYPPDPSLWSQSLCEEFNSKVDRLLELVKRELAASFEILDRQERYVEDPRLRAWLAQNPGYTRLDRVSKSTVR